MREKRFLLGILIVIMFIILTSCSLSKIAKNSTTASDAELNNGIRNGNLERVKEAIEDGANLNSIKVSAASEENPIILALLKNQERIAEYLVNNGADVNYSDSSGRSLLMFSAYNTNISFCNFLIQHGAKVNQEDKKGYTALEYALDHNKRATNGNYIKEIISNLMANGAKIRSITLEAELNGSKNNNESRYDLERIIVDGLLKQETNPNLDPAVVASLIGDYSKLASLIKNTQVDEQQQILFFIAAFGDTDSINLLIGKGANLDITDKQQNTLLILASQYGNLDIVKFLIDKDCDTIAVNSDGMSALYTAVKYDHFEVVKYLIENKENILLNDISNTKNILSAASANGNIDMMNFIISSGYTLNNNNHIHWTVQ